MTKVRAWKAGGSSPPAPARLDRPDLVRHALVRGVDGRLPVLREGDDLVRLRRRARHPRRALDHARAPRGRRSSAAARASAGSPVRGRVPPPRSRGSARCGSSRASSTRRSPPSPVDLVIGHLVHDDREALLAHVRHPHAAAAAGRALVDDDGVARGGDVDDRRHAVAGRRGRDRRRAARFDPPLARKMPATTTAPMPTPAARPFMALDDMHSSRMRDRP